MGAPLSESTMSTTAAQGWKSRFSGRRPSAGFHEKGKEETTTTTTTKAITLTTTSATVVNVSEQEASVQVNGVKSDNDASTTQKSARFKKKMSGRFRHMLPGSQSTRALKDSASDDSPSNPQTPQSQGDGNPGRGNRNQDQDNAKKSLTEWHDAMEERRDLKMVQRKQLTKERDGFCRNIDSYDGSVIIIDGKPTYELGNYLGGGVAGVVYEGNRLLPSDQYPVRTGVEINHIMPTLVPPPRSTFSCLDSNSVIQESSVMKQQRSAASALTNATADSCTLPRTDKMATNECAIETTADDGQGVVLVDRQDAPSRSNAAAIAAMSASQWFMEETVAVKILNPVGFRLLPADQSAGAVVVKKGVPMSMDVQIGKMPMQEKHIWWLVNPSSRNLQTLQRYNQKNKEGNLKKTRDVDRGTVEKGLRLSLVAAYMDSIGSLKELPLTRCIEVWGHVPFEASDQEFEEMMEAIERVNAGQPPVPHPPSRQTTSSSSTGSINDFSTASGNIPLYKERTGLFRAAAEERSTLFCEPLNAYIALPAVPPKYLRWLRQRRAATKEIRNMMLIGRHRNVVHLYEVLEFIQESKSTMFLVLELVRGGELFDLISNTANSGRRGFEDSHSEKAMRKFFQELSSGIYYCHTNGIAHRDLKPENLLVHNGPGKESTLKIADFGLSAVFELDDQATVFDSLASPIVSPIHSPIRISGRGEGSFDASSPPINDSHVGRQRANSFQSNMTALGATALTFLTCGVVDDVAWCAPGSAVDGELAPRSSLRRMTSVVGSPHYVAPEIIMQTDDKEGRRKKNTAGYDGTKADVWSAGVILYAMLFRSLPFGEDLLRCPRYQSFRKWYIDARVGGTRRASGVAALNPHISATDAADQLGPPWFFPSETSVESRDLIVAMLNPDPDERLSIEMVLRHPWLINMPGEVEFRNFNI